MTTTAEEKETSATRNYGASIEETGHEGEINNTPLESTMSSVKEAELEDEIEYPSGFRLAVIVIALGLSIFLVRFLPSS